MNKSCGYQGQNLLGREVLRGVYNETKGVR